MIKMFMLAFCFLFFPPMLPPIFYVLFNSPKPELWMLPLDVKYVRYSFEIYVTLELQLFFSVFRVILNDKTPIGFFINLLPQALTACNCWLNWILFLSFFISLLTFVEACVADFEASIDEICNQYDDLGRTKMKTDLFLNQTIELHAELTK